MKPLDRLDAQLLTLIQTDNRRSYEELGEAIGLSPTSCQRRLRRLREDGVIEAEIAVVSPQAVGRRVQMLVMVTLERERADIIDRFKAAIRDAPEVMSGFYVTGEADFVLTITARDMEAYEAFTRRFFYESREVKSFKTLVVMDRVKAGLAIPVEIDAD